MPACSENTCFNLDKMEEEAIFLYSAILTASLVLISVVATTLLSYYLAPTLLTSFAVPIGLGFGLGISAFLFLLCSLYNALIENEGDDLYPFCDGGLALVFAVGAGLSVGAFVGLITGTGTIPLSLAYGAAAGVALTFFGVLAVYALSLRSTEDCVPCAEKYISNPTPGQL